MSAFLWLCVNSTLSLYDTCLVTGYQSIDAGGTRDKPKQPASVERFVDHWLFFARAIEWPLFVYRSRSSTARKKPDLQVHSTVLYCNRKTD